MNNQRVEELIQLAIHILKNHLDNFTLYLFGSRSKGLNLKNADIDLAIDTSCDKRLVKKAKAEIEEIDTLYSIDIVNMNETDKQFKEIILKSGKKLYTYAK